MIITDKAIRISGAINVILGLSGMWEYLKYDNTGFNIGFIMYVLSGVAFVFGLLVLFKEEQTSGELAK